MKLLEANAFWSYDDVSEEEVSDEDIIEKTLMLLDMDDIFHALNMMIAQYYFNIKSPEQYLRRKEISHIHKITHDAGL